MKYRGFIISHKGKIRTNNEDNAYLNGYYRRDDGKSFWTYQDESTNNMLAAVFDGMGGIENGEIASRLAAQELAEIEYQDETEIIQLSTMIHSYAADANRRIALYDDEREMGTTCAILSIEKDHYFFFNLGDSRGYLFRDGELCQMTKDHNIIWEMVKKGILTKEQAERHPDRHSIYQCLGMKEQGEILEPQVFCADSVEAQKGDICLLCSDGLTDMLSDYEIQNILSTDKFIEDKVIELFRQALEKGGKDNVTIVVVEAE